MADGITFVARNLQFDGRAFSEAMNREMETLFHEAARAFLIASTRRIPIRTGFLRGAFTRLEDVVGAFESTTGAKLNRSGVAKPRSGPRPGKDLASAANKLVRLRQKQTNILKRIRILQQRERKRRVAFNEKLSKLQSSSENNFLRERKLQALSAASRGRALRERAITQSLIKQAQNNERDISRALQTFKEKFESDGIHKLRANVDDTVHSLKLRDYTLQQKRNEAFQRALRNLNRAYYGGRSSGALTVTPRPGFPANRTAGRISQDEFTNRLRRLREKISQPTRTQRRLQQHIEDVNVSLLGQKAKSKLQAYAQKLREKYSERAADAETRFTETGQRDLLQEARLERQIQKKLRRAVDKVLSKKKEDHPLLAAAQSRLARQQKIDDFQLEQLRQELQGAGETLNVTARTTRGRIVGQNSPGKFNLAGGERVKKIFNQRDKEGKLLNEFREYYYPTKGTPETKVLKTPRSGRRFATPANAIILRINNPPNPNLALFQQLAGFVKASGGTVREDVARAAQDTTKITTRYEFHFAVDIRYLAVNDARLAWESWLAGINAFSYVINSKAPGRLPNLANFQYVVTRQLRPGQSRTISGRK